MMLLYAGRELFFMLPLSMSCRLTIYMVIQLINLLIVKDKNIVNHYEKERKH